MILPIGLGAPTASTALKRVLISTRIHPSRPGTIRKACFKCHNCGEHKSLLEFVKEQAPNLLLPPAAPSETLTTPSESSSSGQKVTKLPKGQSVSDNLWRSRHMPRHLYRGNARTIKSNNEDRV